MIYPVKQIVDGMPTFERPMDDILAELRMGGAMETLTPLRHITERQRRWYKGVCLRDLSKHDENAETVEWWDDEVKRECKGLSLLKKEVYFYQDITGNKIGIGRLTTKGVGKKNMTDFIEEILSVAMTKNWPITAPNPDLRRS